MTLSIVVLISGNGSNLQAILDAARASRGKFRVGAVISNRPGVYGLERARLAGVPTHVLEHREFPSREAFDAALHRQIDAYAPGLVLLAGFMRILTPEFVHRYTGRMFNIHPSLLPAFRGLHTHRRALEAGVAEHGATVHFVVPELDSGPPIIQARVPVLPDDTEEVLAARVLEQEHRIYPQAVQWFAEGRLQLREGKVWLDGEALDGPVDYLVPHLGNESDSKESKYGTVYIDLELNNPAVPGLQPMKVTGLVDTGAITLCIPEYVALQLKLEETEQRMVTTSDGKSHTVPYMGPVKVCYAGRTCYTGAVVLGDSVLVGAVPLEDMDLVVSPGEQKVMVNPKSPNIPSAIVKGCTGHKR